MKTTQQKIIFVLVLCVFVYGVLIFYFDARFFSWAQIQHLKNFIFVSLGLVCINYVIRFFRWQWCLSQKNIKIPWKFSLLIFLSGFIMSITPGKLGETLKSFLLNQQFQIPMTSTLPVVLVERISDVLGLMMLVLLGFFSYPEIRLWALVGLAGMIFSLWLIQSPVCFKLFFYFLQRTRWRNRSQALHDLWSNISFFIHWRRLFPLALISSFAWCLEGLAVWCLGLGITEWHSQVEPSIFVYSLTTLAGALSFLPGGVGITEAGMVSLFQWFNVVENQTQASLLTLLTRLFTLWWGVGIGCIGFIFYKFSFSSAFPPNSHDDAPNHHST